ncbi:MAG TPA: ATP-binding protein [Phenylobacterium sp.]
MSSVAAPSAAPNPDFLSGSSEMGRLIRATNWAGTPLGGIEGWPQSLRTAVSLCLASNFPINIIWGPEHTQIYNDGYRVVCGEAHPDALGQSYTQTWASAWPAIGQPFDAARVGQTSYIENQRMFLFRNGYLEETFFTFSLSPIRDESGGIGGLFHPVTETTAAMLSERRTRALRDLNAAVADARMTPDVISRALQTLARFEYDLPFLLFYRLDDDGAAYELAGQAGVAADTPISPRQIFRDAARPWPMREITENTSVLTVDGLRRRFGDVSCGPYEEAPDVAVLMPMVLPGSTLPAVLVVAGASPRVPYDEAYRDFFGLLGAALSAALANARTYEEERARAEALAALDRAKIAFFSNVSHEFRTPLTLIFAPLEEALAEADPSGDQHGRLKLAHRNAQRLLKLVNSLLDFARLEAGRVQAIFQPTDLPGLTAELASNFRSACETAGLTLTIDCPPLAAPVYVDQDMWEKAVLNLISNAFKFTLAGAITVSLREEAGGAALRVRDTGVGIPEMELPHVFERFHRVEGQRGRTHEGAGIGLALVDELVRLHSGQVSVESRPGEGSEFRIWLPYGAAHLPRDQMRAERPQDADTGRVRSFVDEALRWLPEAASTPADAEEIAPVADRPRVLLADDNADMRAYIGRILTQGGYAVRAVENGAAALRAVRAEPPELVLSDVMMPELDGFGLLAALRADPDVQGLPVILLSARAGEEARVEGLAAGADDYLVKPFSARELRARIDGAVNLGRQRRYAAERERDLMALVVEERGRRALEESERRLQMAMDAGRMGGWELDPTTNRLFASEHCRTNFGLRPDERFETYDHLLARIYPEDREMVRTIVQTALDERSTLDLDHRVMRPDGTLGWIMVRGQAVQREADGRIILQGVALDITVSKRHEERQKLLLDELNHRVKNTLATVQSIALQARRGADTPEAFANALEARISALAVAHDLLNRSAWEGASLEDVVSRTLSHHAAHDAAFARVRFAGPPVRLGPNAAVSLSMAFHELATNAAKYGALSNMEGLVDVRWNVDPAPDDPRLHIRWTESGGPLVNPPERRGFGSRLIERGLARELGGEVVLGFDATGVTCHMRLPTLGQVHPLDMPDSGQAASSGPHARN